MNILIDTNLLIYVFDQNNPTKQKRAEDVLGRLEAARSGRLSVQSLAEFVSASTRRLQPPLSPKQAYEQVVRFAAIWPIFDLTPLIVLEAARGVDQHSLSFYDAQIWAAARLNQVPVIFSEDFQDGMMLEGIKFINPFSNSFVLSDWLL